jgi:hypothetical protein
LEVLALGICGELANRDDSSLSDPVDQFTQLIEQGLDTMATDTQALANLRKETSTLKKILCKSM